MAAPTSTLSVSLQQDLLCAVTFSPTAAPIIRNAVEPKLYGVSTYRDFAVRIYGYLDQYRKPPGTHLPDLFEGELEGDSEEVLERKDLIGNIFEHKDRFNEEFVLRRVEEFVRQQTLKSSIIAATEAIQDGELDEAERVLGEGLKARVAAFTPGSTLADGLRKIFADEVRQNIIPLGIKELDRAVLGPARGEFILFIAPPKRGKSWFLIWVARQSLMHRSKVLYITLELSEAQIEQRLIQCLFSVSRRKALGGKHPVTRIETDDLGRFMRLTRSDITGRLTFDDPANKRILQHKLARLHARDNLLVKGFPSRSLTMAGLDAYLDMLERACGFVPDVIVIDYPDYMQIDPKNYRLESMVLYDALRGLAVRRNAAVVVASKSNRAGTKAKVVDETHAAEDYSRIYTADTVLTYSQTQVEHDYGLARIFANATRVGEEDQFMVLISQCYKIGQFALTSAPMAKNYWTALRQEAGIGPGDEEVGE